jgi:cell division transport system permease protein
MGRRFGYFFRETAAALRRNGLVTLAAIATVFISLFLLGASLLARQQVNMMVDLWTQNVEVSVFLREGVSGPEVEQLGRDIGGMPEVASAEFESKEEAYDRFKELFKESPALVENVSADSLPASFQVKLDNPEDFQVISARLTGNPAIEEIRDNRGIVNRLLALTNILRTGALAVAIIMLTAAAGLIGNTVRMAVFARRREIAIMKLVGATNWFIRVPFLIEGMVQGLLGAGFAILGLFLMKVLFIDPLRTGQTL